MEPEKIKFAAPEDLDENGYAIRTSAAEPGEIERLKSELAQAKADRDTYFQKHLDAQAQIIVLGNALEPFADYAIRNKGRAPSNWPEGDTVWNDRFMQAYEALFKTEELSKDIKTIAEAATHLQVLIDVVTTLKVVCVDQEKNLMTVAGHLPGELFKRLCEVTPPVEPEALEAEPRDNTAP